MDPLLRDILDDLVRLNLIPQGGPGTTVNFFVSLLRNALVLMFAGIIVVAIFYVLLAGFQYIRSQGDAEKVEAAQNSLKTVFIGILAVFVGIIGVFLITGIFTNTGNDQLRESLCVFIEPNNPLADCVSGSAGN